MQVFVKISVKSKSYLGPYVYVKTLIRFSIISRIFWIDLNSSLRFSQGKRENHVRNIVEIGAYCVIRRDCS